MASEQPWAQGIIFDLDGTLLDTLPALAETHNRMLAQFGFPGHPVEAYKQFVGNGARKCVERCLPAAERSAEVISQGVSVQQGFYQDAWQAGSSPYPGIVKLLGELAVQKIPLAVLSNKDDHFTRQIISHFFGDALFQQVLGHSSKVPHKPDPAGALLIAEALRLDPRAMAIVGDSAMDMETAVACNMQAVGVSWGFRTRQELLSAGAALILDDPLSLLQLQATAKGETS